MSLVKDRTEQLLLEISRIAPHDPSLKTLANLGHIAGRISDSAQGRHGSGSGHQGFPSAGFPSGP